MSLHDVDGDKPIYIQIADWLENAIIDGTLNADEKVYSQYQLAELFTINPATAGKGLTILLEEELVYKKRGLGMFVSPDAQKRLRTKRKEQTLRKLVQDLLLEADLLGINKNELDKMIEKEREYREGEPT
ncbi:GntR family transcriptional regulator [Sporosarcina aquimarina]|uniref:GntR family transcriptional regulator n=2 Tax=Sporosarcina aquimarina TaxID=114975 RepID=A0ABU4FUU3_9BACL|nr:GntR family transcriptional regulator [Sporosarcina aquimarina]